MRTAVILAARKERDSLIPYPLKQFSDDVCLMDRNIAILRENGIENILIVVGVKHELFDKYKSENITLICNKEFEFTASMGHLLW